MTLADKLVVLNKGNVEQVGTPLEIYDRPASLFVATFIGSPAMNILDAKVTPEGIELGCSLLPINTQSINLGDVKLGLRPEHLQIVDSNPWFEVEVELIEALGADLLLYCQTLDDKRQSLVVRVQGHLSINIGDTLNLDINLQHLNLFEPSTEKNLYFDSNLLDKKEVIYA